LQDENNQKRITPYNVYCNYFKVFSLAMG